MGSTAQQFCLKWNNHQANMLAVFDRLLGSKSLVDVTLGCEGRQVKAHKVVLSACSPFFEGLFTENPCKHPIVILKDIRYADLKALVEFMYKGEVNVVQEQLPTLLKTAEALKIKGLAEVTGETKDEGGSSNNSQQQTRSAANATPRPESPNSARRKRQRARRRSTDSVGGGGGDGLSDSEESVPKTSRTDLHDESSMDGASSHDDGSQASLQRGSKKETAPVQTNVDSTSSPASASASAKSSRSVDQTLTTSKSAANSNGQIQLSKDSGGGDFEPSRLLEASMTTDQGGDDSTDNLNNTTGPDNNSTNNELDIKPLITLDEGGATPAGAIVPASAAAAAAALAGADALSSLFPQGASAAAALAGTSFQNSPPSHDPASNTAASSSNSNNGGVGHCSSISSSSRSATCPNTSTSKSGCMGAITSGGLLVPSSSNAVVAHNGASSQSSNNPGSSYWGTGAFIVQHKFTRAKSYYIDDEGKPKADPKQLRWSASDTEVMELVQGSGVYIKLLDLVNVYYRTKNAISAARRLLVCVFNDQTLMERSVKGSPDRPGLCPLTHQAILDCVEMISQCKPQDWAADETMINRSLIVRLCELRSKRTAKIYVTSQPNPSAHPAPFPEIHLS